jgi:hypothetical protein
MPHTGNPLRPIAVIYGVVVLLAAMWALVVDVRLLHSEREHLLPAVLLAFIAMPASLTIGPLYEYWPMIFGNEFVQVAWATVCGLAQAVAVFMTGRLWARGSRAA